MDEDALVWKTLEYEPKEHSTDWYWSVGVVGIAAAVVAIVLNNVIFGIFLIVGTITLLLQSLRKPRTITCAIDKRGVHVENTLYPFRTLDAFWIEHNTLLLKSSRILSPLISIPLGDVDDETVHKRIGEHVAEEELHEPLSQRFMEYLGF